MAGLDPAIHPNKMIYRISRDNPDWHDLYHQVVR
jgi:hypothetical protein